jgi:succinyl-CoA synthetase beta subunit
MKYDFSLLEVNPLVWTKEGKDGIAIFNAQEN